MSIRIIQGDAISVLRTLPDASVHCVVTSPPYWGLRDYGTGKWEGGNPECEHTLTRRGHGDEKQATSAGTSRDSLAGLTTCRLCGARRIDEQMGLEPTLGEHIAVMVAVFREVRRVLRKDGTCWLNYGDCYATAPNGRSNAEVKAAGSDDRTFRDKPFSTVGPIYDPAGGSKGGGLRGPNKGQGGPEASGRVCAGGTLKPKDLCMIPNRLAIALQDDGADVRACRVIQRAIGEINNAYGDEEAVPDRVMAVLERLADEYAEAKGNSWWVRSEIIWAKPNPMPESVTDRPTSAHEKIFLLTKSARYFYDAEAVREMWADDRHGNPGAPSPKAGRIPGQSPHTIATKEWRSDGLSGRNLRNVWTVPTRGYREAHFATFPPEIPERCIKAGCPKDGVVLDPFAGAGTVGLVADRLQRSAILIELNPEYCDMARKRLEADHGMFGAVAVEQNTTEAA